MQDFWLTLWYPRANNPYALLILIAAQALFCWHCYRKQHHGVALFMGICASANFTRLLATAGG